jgi:hypothetical protein
MGCDSTTGAAEQAIVLSRAMLRHESKHRGGFIEDHRFIVDSSLSLPCLTSI